MTMRFERAKLADNRLSAYIAMASAEAADAIASLDVPENTVFPGFCDVHVHFREPGFSYKETIKSGSMAAAHGGYTAVCTMPNLSPVPDSAEHLACQLNIIRRDAVIHVYPYGAITEGERGEKLADMQSMAENVAAFSDDGRGVQSEDMMRRAMVNAKRLGKVIAAHCEDNTLLRGGYIHSGVYAAEHGHRGICSESEWRQIERDLQLVRETGCAYHICHISTKESVELIRRAKAEGLDVTCETAPHYLVLEDADLQEDGRFKMNPPLRGHEDRLALIEGVIDGTVDMIATDHAPHSPEEKSKGLKDSAFGIVGLETAFPLMYTNFVLPGVISVERLMEMMVYAPRRRFNIGLGTDFSVWDLGSVFTVDPDEFCSKGRSSPFIGQKLYGKCLLCVCGGEIVYKHKN